MQLSAIEFSCLKFVIIKWMRRIYFIAPLYLRIISLDLIPDSFRSSSFHPPLDEAVFFNTEQVSSLSETDHTSQLILFCSHQLIHRCHSSSFNGPSPVASMPADSEIKIGIPFASAESQRSRSHCLCVAA